MGNPSTIIEKDFAEGDYVLVIGRYKGYPQYGEDVIVEFEADPSVTTPRSYVAAKDVINLKKSVLQEDVTIGLIKMLFGKE